jgi:hypothetical protein
MTIRFNKNATLKLYLILLKTNVLV